MDANISIFLILHNSKVACLPETKKNIGLQENSSNRSTLFDEYLLKVEKKSTRLMYLLSERYLESVQSSKIEAFL